jgi:hypothetical protein
MFLRLTFLLALLLSLGCTTRSEKNSNKDQDQPKASAKP